MDKERLRAWIFDRQGLATPSCAASPEALERTGWQRSVGGASPYLALRARTGEGRAQIDARAARLELFELPSARGCTYVLPAAHFALGLTLGSTHAAATEIAVARKLGVPDSEIAALQNAVREALGPGPMDPTALKAALGDRVRNLGEEGKKRGLTTTLPLALGLLQSHGRIRRKPLNGRVDTQRYAYELWTPPLTGFPSHEEAAVQCARLYFGWIGAATLAQFREFTALGAGAAKAACSAAGVVPFGDSADLLGLPGAADECRSYKPPQTPAYQLVGNLDSFLLLRRGDAFWLADEDRDRPAPTDKGQKPLSGLSELWSHAILDRGRLVGLWEFDPDEGAIVWSAWVPRSDALCAAIQATEAFVREDLGDARSFSLDSPASRRPRLDGLRALGQTQAA